MGINRDALELCIATARQDPAYAKRIDEALERREDWFDIATSASFHCQMEALHLQPWQVPPGYIDLDDPTRRTLDAAGVELLKRMLALGVSRWHPDPANECDRVEAEGISDPANIARAKTGNIAPTKMARPEGRDRTKPARPVTDKPTAAAK